MKKMTGSKNLFSNIKEVNFFEMTSKLDSVLCFRQLRDHQMKIKHDREDLQIQQRIQFIFPNLHYSIPMIEWIQNIINRPIYHNLQSINNKNPQSNSKQTTPINKSIHKQINKLLLHKQEPNEMIVSNHQKQLQYFKQYPCYSITTHLSEHRQLQFANVTFVQFSHQTSSKSELPKYFIDKYQSPHQMYWLEWRMEHVAEAVIEEGKRRVIGAGNSGNTVEGKVGSSVNVVRKYRCLYIAELGKMAHIKLVFNYDPEMVAICQDFIYTIGANQLIVTELWPETTISIQNINSNTQIPPKQSQIVHKLNNDSKVLSMDFVYDEMQGAICKVVYFHEKKGLYCQSYRKNQSSEASLINRIYDLSLKFKRNEPEPFFYQTLVPNILAIVFHNAQEFTLFNLTEMKPIETTRTTLEGWQLTPHQPILVKSMISKTPQTFNDALMISIGQGHNIEAYIYYMQYSEKAMLICPRDNVPKNASEIRGYPIHMFTSASFIDFQSSKLQHFTVIHLQNVTYLQSYILNNHGVVYLGYQKNGALNDVDIVAEEIPITGFIYYEKPYITHEVLTQENKIWKEYKMDILCHSSQQSHVDPSLTLQRILIPGRYERHFIEKTLHLNKFSDLSTLLQSNQQTASQIHQKLVFQWRNQYKFVEFTIYKNEILIIRRNSISTLIMVNEEQYLQEKDSLAEQQVSYNELLSRGFSVHYDLEGDQYIDDEFDVRRYRNPANSSAREKNSIVLRNGKSYEEKLRSINSLIRNYMQGGVFEHGIQKQKDIQYEDEQEIAVYSQKYIDLKNKIIILATQHDTHKQPHHFPKYTQESMISLPQDQSPHHPSSPPHPQQNYIQLHTSILSLRVKDVLSNWLTTLKINYEYYFEYLDQQKQKQSQNEPTKETTLITPKLLHLIHLEHMYFVFVIEWIVGVGSRYHLQEQYQFVGEDLVERFVEEYVERFYHKQEGARSWRGRKGQQKEQNRFFKEDLEFHVQNIVAHMFKNLLKDSLPHEESLGMSEFLVDEVFEVDELPSQTLTSVQINRLNKGANTFLLMLLKQHSNLQTKQNKSNFIAHDLLMRLFKPLLIEPFNGNIESLIPINKTFVYSVLSLPLAKQEKKRILSCHLHKKDFLALLLLIQLENNCYLTIEEELDVEILELNLAEFEQNTIRLNKEACCILEDLILTNYTLFLFPTESQSSKIIQERPARTSVISEPEYQANKIIRHEQLCIKLIKSLFSNIEFRYLTSIAIHDKKHPLSSQPSSYDNKAIAETYKQLIDQVEEINEKYGNSKGSKIQRAFKKFYNKIYQKRVSKKNASQRENHHAVRNTTESYPEMTGLGYKLSEQELNVIKGLYQKHHKILKMQKRDTFESTSLIQQRLNLQYAMIQIHLFRIKIALKELPTLTQSQKQTYVLIMKKCVETLIEALGLFKHSRGKLCCQENGQDMSDEELLETLKEIEQMENSRVWDRKKMSVVQGFGQNETDRLSEKWSILGLPITLPWLNLLRLTSLQSSPLNNINMPQSQSSQQLFTNYQSQDAILMKILMVIKAQTLTNQFKTLNDLFGQQKIKSVIERSNDLRKLYANGLQGKSDRGLIVNGFGSGRSEGLLTGMMEQKISNRTTKNSIF